MQQILDQEVLLFKSERPMDSLSIHIDLQALVDIFTDGRNYWKFPRDGRNVVPTDSDRWLVGVFAPLPFASSALLPDYDLQPRRHRPPFRTLSGLFCCHRAIPLQAPHVHPSVLPDP